MAKSTTTTKAKTKTTKKKPTTKAAAKTTKKTTTAKAATKPKATTTKTTSKVVKSTKDTKVTVTKSVSKVDAFIGVLSRWQVRAGLLLTALAVAAGFLMKSDSVQVFLGHLTKDELLSRSGTTLAAANHVVFEAEIRWLLVTVLAVAAMLALVRGTRYFAKEQAGVKARTQSLRWFDYGVTGALMFELVAVLNGVSDVIALKFGALFVVLAAFFGWLYERENASTNKPARALLVGAQVSVALPVLALAATMISTSIYGMVRSPWYAYAAAAVVAVGLIGTVRMLGRAVKNRNGAHDYSFVDRNYNVLSLATKALLAVVLIIGLYAK